MAYTPQSHRLPLSPKSSPQGSTRRDLRQAATPPVPGPPGLVQGLTPSRDSPHPPASTSSAPAAATARASTLARGPPDRAPACSRRRTPSRAASTSAPARRRCPVRPASDPRRLNRRPARVGVRGRRCAWEGAVSGGEGRSSVPSRGSRPEGPEKGKGGGPRQGGELGPRTGKMATTRRRT